jgi:hypothetical protein
MTIKVSQVNGVTITEHFGADGKEKESEIKADGFQTRLEQIKAQQEKSKNVLR